MHDPAFDDFNKYPITPAPPPGVLRANHFRASHGYRVRRPAGTRDWLLTFTVDGVGRYQLAGKIQHCQVGDVLLLEPGAMHDYATDAPTQPWEFYWAHFLPRPHWSEWMQLSERAPGLRGVTISDASLQQRMQQTFERLLRDLAHSTRLYDDLAATALEEILLCVALHTHGASSQGLDPRVELVVKLLTANYRQPMTIPELAQQVSLSPSRLAHLFKQQTDKSIVESIIEIRLQQAARLLEYSSLPVGEIAKEVGFQSASYLWRQFTAFYGTSPQSYRCYVQRDGEAEKR